MAKKEDEKKVIEPNKKTEKSANKKSNVNTKQNVDSKEEIKDMAVVADDKISRVDKAASEKMGDVATNLKDNKRETKVVTSETMTRVLIALVFVVIIWVTFQIFAIIFGIGKNLFNNDEWAEDRAEIYLSGFSNHVMADDIDCDEMYKYKGGNVLKCELDSFDLIEKWNTKELYVGVTKYRDGSVSYCAPSVNKSEIKKCLKEK